MVERGRSVERDVPWTFVAAAALMASNVVVVVVVAGGGSGGVVDSVKSDCDTDQYYDDLADECRSCDLLCDPAYRTRRLCAEKCPEGRGLWLFSF